MPSLVSSLLIMPAFFPWLEVLFVGVRKFQQVFQECPPLLQVPAPLFTSLSLLFRPFMWRVSKLCSLVDHLWSTYVYYWSGKSNRTTMTASRGEGEKRFFQFPKRERRSHCWSWTEGNAIIRFDCPYPKLFKLREHCFLSFQLGVQQLSRYFSLEMTLTGNSLISRKQY